MSRKKILKKMTQRFTLYFTVTTKAFSGVEKAQLHNGVVIILFLGKESRFQPIP